MVNEAELDTKDPKDGFANMVFMEMVYTDDSPGSDDTTERSTISVKARSKSLWQLVTIMAVGWLVLLALLALFVTLFPPENQQRSLSIATLITSTISFVGSSMLLTSGLLHHIHGKVR